MGFFFFFGLFVFVGFLLFCYFLGFVGGVYLFVCFLMYICVCVLNGIVSLIFFSMFVCSSSVYKKILIIMC